MKNKSKVIVGIIIVSILLLFIVTASAVVFPGLENEETMWTDTGTTTIPTEPIYLINLGIALFLILVIAILILIYYYTDNKGLTVGYVIVETCAIISLMFLIVGIAILYITFIISTIIILIILLKPAIGQYKKNNKFLRE